MSEDLTRLIDKVIGKKGRLRVPAYWMHKVLSGIVAYVKEQAETLTAKVQSVSTGLLKELEAQISDVREYFDFNIEQISKDLLSETSGWTDDIVGSIEFKQHYETRTIMDILPPNTVISYGFPTDGFKTIYALLDENSSLMYYNKKLADNLGLYRISIQNLAATGPTLIDVKKVSFLRDPIAIAVYQAASDTGQITFGAGNIIAYHNGIALGKKAYFEPGEEVRVVIKFNNNSSFNVPQDCFGVLSYHGKLKSMTLLEPIDEIEFNAFSHTSIESIVLPDTLTKIWNEAFQYCPALTEIDIPDSVTDIGARTFRGCTALRRVIMGKSITELSNPFGECSALEILDFSKYASVPDVHPGLFVDLATSYKIVVPDALYEEWTTARVWSRYVDHIVKASEYVETE